MNKLAAVWCALGGGGWLTFLICGVIHVASGEAPDGAFNAIAMGGLFVFAVFAAGSLAFLLLVLCLRLWIGDGE